MKRLASPLSLLLLLEVLIGAALSTDSVGALFTDTASVPGNTLTTAASFGCTPGNTGFLSPTAEAADTGGDGDGFELNPTNAFADDTAFASNIDNQGAEGGDRHRFYDYGFVISAGCAVEGIEVRLDWWIENLAGINSMSVELSWDGGTSWTAAKADPTETKTEHTAILGNPADTWGRSWTLTELSDANFRVRITCVSTNNKRDYFLDWVPVKVYYGPP